MLRKVSILVFGLIVASLFFRCSDDFDKNDNGVMFGKKNNHYRYLTGQQALEIATKLEIESKRSKKLQLFSNSGAAFRSNVGEIDYSLIMEVLDGLGNKNYTFRILNHPDDDEFTFHNLVVNFQHENDLKVNIYKFENITSDFKWVENSTIKSISVDPSEPCDPVIMPLPVGSTGGGGTGGGGSDPIYGGGGGSSGDPYWGNGNGSGGGGSNQNVSITNVTFQCNSCNISASSWEEFSAHGAIYAFTVILHRMVSNPTLENPCDVPGDVGVLVPVNKDDCKKINNMMQPEFENMVDDINLLKAHINESSVERSISYKKTVDSDGTPTISKVHKVGTHNSVEIMTGGFFYGSIHVHPIGKDPMFSWKDIKSFAEQYDETVNSRIEDLFIMIVCPNDLVYCLRIEDPQTFVDKVNEFWNNPKLGSTEEKKKKKANNITKEAYKNDSNNERAFLKMFENYGLSLYKAHQSVSNWLKLSLNQTSNSVVSHPCN